MTAVLLAYAVGFALYWPGPILISDEAAYVGAAFAFAHGRTTVERRDGRTGEVRRELPSHYQPGTSALQAPLVAALGVRGAPLLSALCYLLTGLALVAWLQREGRSPLFALLFLGFLPALVLGRASTSDLPSVLVVLLCQWLVFEGTRLKGRAAAAASFVAGLLAGGSLLLRETNALMVAPLLLGRVLRREPHGVLLVAGGLIGTSARLLAAWVLFGHPFFVRENGYGWYLASAIHHLSLYLGTLIFFTPLALPAVLAYRGPRRPELIATALGVLAFFLAYQYSGEESGLLKQLVLGPRFFIPLVPLLVIGAAESIPRVWSSLRRSGAQRLEQVIVVAWPLLVGVAAVAVHPVLASYGRAQGALADALVSATSPAGVVVLDGVETGKYLNEWSGPRSTVDLIGFAPSQLPSLVARDGVAFLALMDRRDSAFHREHGALGEAWRLAAQERCTLKPAHDSEHGEVRLRVFRVESCR